MYFSTSYVLHNLLIELFSCWRFAGEYSSFWNINSLSQDKQILFKAIFSVNCYPHEWRVAKFAKAQNKVMDNTASYDGWGLKAALVQLGATGPACCSKDGHLEQVDQGSLQLGFFLFTTFPNNHFLKKFLFK